MFTEKTEHMDHRLSGLATSNGILSFLVLFLFMLFGADAEESKSINESGTVARVNKASISLRDISYRIKTEEAYGNDSVTASIALVSLVNDAIECEVALRNDIVITQEEIISFGKYVDENFHQWW